MGSRPNATSHRAENHSLIFILYRGEIEAITSFNFREGWPTIFHVSFTWMIFKNVAKNIPFHLFIIALVQFVRWILQRSVIEIRLCVCVYTRIVGTSSKREIKRRGNANAIALQTDGYKIQVKEWSIWRTKRGWRVREGRTDRGSILIRRN